MKPRKGRLKKSPERRLKELRTFTVNLELAIDRFEKGEEEAMSDILTNLRTLIGQRRGRNKGLLHSVADQYELVCYVHMEGDTKITMDDYLAQVQLHILGEPISNAEFVWTYGSQIAAHSDEGIDEIFAEAESYHVGGMSMVHRIVYGIAKTVHLHATSLVKILEENGKRLEGQLRAIGKWK